MRNNMSAIPMVATTARSVAPVAVARKMIRVILAVASVVGIVGAMPAHAQTTSESLSKIESETLILKARERQLQVQSEILTKQNEIAAKQSSGNVTSETQIVGDPVVRSVEGIGSAMFATVQMSDGSIIDVQRGNELPNGMHVVSIAPNEVIVRSTGGTRIRLKTYSAVSANSTLDFGLKSPVAGGTK